MEQNFLKVIFIFGLLTFLVSAYKYKYAIGLHIILQIGNNYEELSNLLSLLCYQCLHIHILNFAIFPVQIQTA